MTHDPLVGKVLADRFEILERIGEGGTGVVYKAKQLSVDRVVAIKILGAHVSTDPSWVKRFHNEARAASRLDHPNTVRLIDFGQTKEGLLFIAMEFLHGRSLRQELDRVGKLPANRVLRIISQACQSLQEAHSQGIIHRDIKPDNIYLVEMKGAGDFVKVLDFSVAKLDTPDAQVTRAGVVFGTPAYMSPEQGRGVALDARSDVYALGIVMYEMLSGKPPFDAKNPTEVVMMHLREQPAPLTGVPPQLAALVMKALHKDPSKRQQTAEQLDQECQAVMAELFPRQTPGAGVAPVAAPPPAIAQQRTMIAQPAPVLATGPTMEQKTVMAGMQAPVIPSTAPAGPGPVSAAQEQKTVMAGMQAPNIPGGIHGLPNIPGMGPVGGPMGSAGPAGSTGPTGSAPPPSSIPTGVPAGLPNIPGMGPIGGPMGGMGGVPPSGQHHGGPIAAGSEQKTVMAGMQAPVLPAGSHFPPVSQGQEQKTILAPMAAPVIPPASAAQKTVAVSAPSGAEVNPMGTQILPDSQGVVAFAREQANQARQAAARQPEPESGGGAAFWVAWVLIGIGAGLGLHFFGITQKLGF
jgi:serine/threonine-protein kinase